MVTFLASYGVYISQLIRFARVCNHVTDFNARNKCLTAKLLHQGYRYHKLRKTFSKFYRRHYELISNVKNLKIINDYIIHYSGHNCTLLTSQRCLEPLQMQWVRFGPVNFVKDPSHFLNNSSSAVLLGKIFMLSVY